MLRILRVDIEEQRALLVLEGHLVAEWSELLDRECVELSRTGVRVVVDLSGVVFIGRSGVEVLRRLGQAGLGINGCSPLIAEVLEEAGIDVARNVGHAGDSEERGGAVVRQAREVGRRGRTTDRRPKSSGAATPAER